jgi:hypothetical protein
MPGFHLTGGIGMSWYGLMNLGAPLPLGPAGFEDENGLYVNKDGTRSAEPITNDAHRATVGAVDMAEGLANILGIDTAQAQNLMETIMYVDEEGNTGFDVHTDLFLAYGAGEKMGDIVYQAFQINKGYTMEENEWADTPYQNSRFRVIGRDEKEVPIIAARVGAADADNIIVAASPHGDEQSAKWLIMDSQRRAGIAEDLRPGSTPGAIYFIPSISPTLQFADARGIPNGIYDGNGLLTVTIQELFDNQTNDNRRDLQNQGNIAKYAVGADANRDAQLRLKSTREFIEFMENVNTGDVSIASIMIHGYGSYNEAAFYFQGDFSQRPFSVGQDNTAIGNALRRLMGYSAPVQGDNYVYEGKTPAEGEYLRLLAARGIWSMDIELPPKYGEGHRPYQNQRRLHRPGAGHGDHPDCLRNPENSAGAGVRRSPGHPTDPQLGNHHRVPADRFYRRGRPAGGAGTY